jgi:hypothetical protein
VGLSTVLFAVSGGFRQIHLTRPISLSLINAVVTVYIGAGGILLGWLAGRSLSFMFALIGVVILVAQWRSASTTGTQRWTPINDRRPPCT